MVEQFRVLKPELLQAVEDYSEIFGIAAQGITTSCKFLPMVLLRNFFVCIEMFCSNNGIDHKTPKKCKSTKRRKIHFRHVLVLVCLLKLFLFWQFSS